MSLGFSKAYIGIPTSFVHACDVAVIAAGTETGIITEYLEVMSTPFVVLDMDVTESIGSSTTNNDSTMPSLGYDASSMNFPTCF